MKRKKKGKGKIKHEIPFEIVIKPDFEDGGYVAYIPGCPGCMAQGDTLSQCIEQIKNAYVVWVVFGNPGWR